MSYPYGWTPQRVKPTSASQVRVFDTDGKPAVLSTPISVTNGTIAFSLQSKGNYTIRVRGSFESEVDQFIALDPTPTPTRYVTKEQLENPTSDIRTVLNATYGSVSMPVVFVSTGAEARPTGTLVFWVGGETQPINMSTTDLWFAPIVDMTAPSAPTALAASAVASTSFTLTWTASTDNVGVSGYDVYLGDILSGSVTAATTVNLSGLTAGTNYSVTVKAKDAIGNVSAASMALSVTTSAAAAGTPQHSIWGTTAYPYVVTKDTGTPITVATGFYSYGTTPDMSAWRVVGMKIWIPTGVTITGPIACKAWFGETTLLSATPNATGTLAAPVAGQWNQVLFNVPIETNAGDTVFVGYRIPNGDVLSISTGAMAYVAALDGSKIVMSETDMKRSKYMYDAGASLENVNAVYSIDVIYDEGPVV